MPGNVTTTLTSNARHDPKTGSNSDSGNLEIFGRAGNDGGWLVSGGLVGSYLVRDGYNLLPRRLYLGVERGPVRTSAGVLVDPQNFRRFAGLEATLGGPGLNLRLHGGRSLNEAWEGGHPNQTWGNWVYGAEFSGAFLNRVYGRLGFSEELTVDGVRDNAVFSYSVNGNLSESLRLFSGGRYLPEDGGFRLDAGASFLIGPVNGQLSYVRTNLPPFFDIRDFPRYNDSRGRLALLFRPKDWIALQASGEVGEHVAAASAGADLKYGGLYFIGRRDRGSNTNAYGGLANLRTPIIKGLLSFEAHGSALFEDGNFIGLDHGLRMDLGAGAVFVPTSWLALTARGGYAGSPIVGYGPYVGVNAVVGAAYSTGNARPDVPRLSHSPAPSRKPAKSAMATVPRLFGQRMQEVFPSFPHNTHVVDQKIGCVTCHSPAPLFDLREDKKALCSDCHDDDDFKDNKMPGFAKLAPVRHAAPVPDVACETCHDVTALEAPTGGWGQIIRHPHDSEISKPAGLAWNGHGSRQDATCRTCHTDSSSVQYNNHTVPACNTCHDGLISPHNPNGWLSGGHVMAARVDVETCTTCHTALSSCRSCHSENGVKSSDTHHGIGFMRFGGDNKMKHGRVAASSGGAVCGACHSPDDARPEAQCKSCHN